MEPDYLLVRVSRELLSTLIADPSAPLHVIGATPHEDGTHELVLRTPTRAELQAEIMRRFRDGG